MPEKKIETVYDLFNGPIYSVSRKLTHADNLVKILQDHFFNHREESMQSDSNRRFCFMSCYGEIQTLLDVLRDQTFEALEIIEAAEELDPFDIAACERPGSEAGDK